jgi:hypothetical protein
MFYRSLGAFGLTVALLLTVTTSDSAAKAKPKKPPTTARKGLPKANSAHEGVIVSVTMAKGSGTVSIVAHHHHHHKKKGKGKGTASAKGGTYQIGSYTKVEKHGKPGSLSDLHKGEHVTIHAKGSVAEKIVIHAHKHKKAKKKKKK